MVHMRREYAKLEMALMVAIMVVPDYHASMTFSGVWPGTRGAHRTSDDPLSDPMRAPRKQRQRRMRRITLGLALARWNQHWRYK